MVAPLEVPRNASEARAQSEGRAEKEDSKGNGAARGIIKAGARKPRTLTAPPADAY
jgi:hypothetical protein